MTVNIFFTNDTDESIVEVFDGEEFVSSKYNLNVANANFHTIWCALGFDLPSNGDYCGTMHPMKMLKALKSVSPDLMTRSHVGENPLKDIFINCEQQVYWGGVDLERAKRYIERLTEIANEALRREEMIVWS
jgi:hypothetical protein